MNMQQFIENRHRFSQDELDKYVGQYVAWSPDGTRIIASDRDPLRLVAAIDAAGCDREQTLVEAITDPDDVDLGGAVLRIEGTDG